MAAGTAAKPSMSLQFLPNARATKLDISWPTVIATTKQATTVPLTEIGATSERYTGTIIDAIPTPRPTIILPAIKIGIVSAVAITIDPVMNRKSLIIIMGFLPIASDVGPAIKDPKNAPSSAKETTSSLSTVDISGHVSLKYS